MFTILHSNRSNTINSAGHSGSNLFAASTNNNADYYGVEGDLVSQRFIEPGHPVMANRVRVNKEDASETCENVIGIK